MTRFRQGATRIARAMIVTASLLVLAIIATAQTDSTPKKRLHGVERAHGVIGGEGHKSYVIHARKGQTMTVQIAWRQAEDNRAEFTVGRSANFYDSRPVKFGRVSKQDTRWVGKIPWSGDYYIYVVAHPSADYSLRVKLK